MKNTSDIASTLAYSEKLRRLSEGHQQETQQLLDTIGELQDDMHELLSAYQALESVDAQKDEKIKEQGASIDKLKARIAELESRPNIHINTKQYTEKLEIGQQIIAVSRASRKKRAINLTNQYSLWDQNELSQ